MTKACRLAFTKSSWVPPANELRSSLASTAAITYRPTEESGLCAVDLALRRTRINALSLHFRNSVWCREPVCVVCDNHAKPNPSGDQAEDKQPRSVAVRNLQTRCTVARCKGFGGAQADQSRPRPALSWLSETSRSTSCANAIVRDTPRSQDYPKHLSPTPYQKRRRRCSASRHRVGLLSEVFR